MPDPIRIVAVSGSQTVPSRTTALVTAVADRVAAEYDVSPHVIEIGAILPELAAGTSREQLGVAAQAALEAVENADVLVVGSPAYRAAYTGAFKLFFDWVGQYSLVNTPTIVTATGGSDRHALLVEHQLRPLFSFFQALTLPFGIYANESDFENYQISSEALQERIETSLARVLPLLNSQLRITRGVDVGASAFHSASDVARPSNF